MENEQTTGKDDRETSVDNLRSVNSPEANTHCESNSPVSFEESDLSSDITNSENEPVPVLDNEVNAIKENVQNEILLPAAAEIKHESYQKPEDGLVVVRLCDRRINFAQDFSVTFDTNLLKIKFRSSDANFLQTYGGSTDTIFEWRPVLFDEISPEQCSHKGKEILLKKADKVPWIQPFKTCSKLPKRSLSTQNGNAATEVKAAPIPLQAPMNSLKPTAKVTPFDDSGTKVKPGETGLRNIGNTCFMNATLQMLVNCKELHYYFLGDHHKKEVNRTNPLGCGGRIALCFGELMKNMWSGMNRVYEPSELKELVAEKAVQFANFAQHDAHEFLSFLLDGLHEDLNRIVSKPLTKTVEGCGRPDPEVSQEAWQTHLQRNDSIIVDLFHGQLKSRLQCPKCSKVSITFDPFAYLPVPFPKAKTETNVTFWPVDPYLPPVKLSVECAVNATTSEVLAAVGKAMQASPKTLRMIDVFNHKMYRVYEPSEVCNIQPKDVTYVFQVHDSSEANEEVLEFYVVQRLLFRKSSGGFCNNCLTQSTRLLACERCYDAFYCGKDCQKDSWPEHKEMCSRSGYHEFVGEPFVISVPKSKATYARLVQLMEARCRYSVNVFQPPVPTDPDTPDALPTSPLTSLAVDVPEEEPRSDDKSDTSSVENNDQSRVQLVLGESRDTWRHGHKLFVIRKCDEDGRTEGGAATVKDNGDEPVELKNRSFLGLDWYNKKFGQDYLIVETKSELEPLKEMEGAKPRSANRSNYPELTDMLTLFSETETLTPDESWYCDQCKEHVEATKRLVLYRLPPLLIIQLKRFIYTTGFQMHRRSKEDRAVNYPLTDLDMRPFLCETAPNDQETLYDLTGVVCHSGTSYFGHYISIGRLSGLDSSQTEIEWRNFDDSTVRQVRQNHALAEDAYLLFYKQRGTKTKDLLTRMYPSSS
uniref:Ubiquitin carboxyl-terminal hydrolase n=1 Tax=Plectus sambesii TaxID=2011161 RepID=A0A914WAM8_9BILA